ncbi:hypothetical protein BDZ94DRAFT_1249672 [Collybia nuda]|uniref:C3H1-type domain-containing protein n=1 Tax=Collybia nuda TaxID=64659 RepID=A0A9P5YE06_9AGAR|nr:hypothetical protein BDZ94DRAFT_1249672 [Collybia nuda]
MTRINPNVAMTNGIPRQFVRGNLNTYNEAHGESVARIVFEPSHGASIDHLDQNVTGSAFREALAWKTSPCKHYIRTQGWCPVGERCQFIHDLSLQSPEYINESRGLPWPDCNTGKIRDGALLVGLLSGDGERLPKSHCWSHVQDYCDTPHCRYFHPRDIWPYMKYTPCLKWFNCADIMNCPFKHPANFPTTMRSDSPRVSRTILPVCYPQVQVYGTTYFDLIGQITSCNYGFTFRATTPLQDNRSCEDQTNTFLPTLPPPPPPPSPAPREEPPKVNQTTISCGHSIAGNQGSISPRTLQHNSHTQRFSVALKGSVLDKSIYTKE